MIRRLPPPWSVKEQAACRSPHWVKVKNPNAPTVTLNEATPETRKTRLLD
jgi:hypothetical protein